MFIPYLTNIDNSYYFRIRIPADMQPYFQCTHFKKSLKTNSKRQANIRVKKISLEIERTFFMIRSGLLTPQLVQEIVNDVKESLLDLHRKHGRKPGVPVPVAGGL